MDIQIYETHFVDTTGAVKLVTSLWHQGGEEFSEGGLNFLN